MCTYNIQIDDRKASVLQTRFKDNHSVELWMQQQMEILIAQMMKTDSAQGAHSRSTRHSLSSLRGVCKSGLTDQQALNEYIADKY